MRSMEGLDNNFVNYGIRRDDLRTIEALCTAEQMDYEWMKDEVLREYHKRRVTDIELSDADTEAVINKALQSIA